LKIGFDLGYPCSPTSMASLIAYQQRLYMESDKKLEIKKNESGRAT